MGLSSQTIKELRDKSGAGMLDCKKALEESEGNVEKAIEWLRKKGINTANKKPKVAEVTRGQIWLVFIFDIYIFAFLCLC